MAFETRETVAEIEVGKDIIRVDAGENSLDLRRYYMNDAGEWAPTKKGIVLNKEILVELLPSIIGAMEKSDVYDVLENCGFEEYAAPDDVGSDEEEEDEEE